MAKLYDLTKVDKPVIAIDEETFNGNVDGRQIKDITICNVLPVYASNTNSAVTKIRALHESNVLEKVEKLKKLSLQYPWRIRVL